MLLNTNIANVSHEALYEYDKKIVRNIVLAHKKCKKAININNISQQLLPSN
jgi:hypothetical protein